MTLVERAVRIGLTGPIGCGKSTVAGWLARRQGVVAIDADQIAREVLDPGTSAVEAVYRRFGERLRSPDGTLDRAALGRIVFADPAALRDLESIVHPAVRPRILDAIAAAEASGAAAVVIEAIKLVEGGLADVCDVIWLVTCDPRTQLERLVGRGDDPADAAARMAAQGDLSDRLRSRATKVIDTTGPADPVRRRVQRALDDVLRPGEAEAPA